MTWRLEVRETRNVWAFVSRVRPCVVYSVWCSGLTGPCVYIWARREGIMDSPQDTLIIPPRL